MKPKNEIIMKKLAQLERRRTRVDNLMVGLLVFLLLLSGVLAYLYLGVAGTWQARAGAAVAFAFVVGYPVLYILKALHSWIKENHLPTWVIEEGADVIQVHGSISLVDWRKVEAQMLAMRSGYMPVVDAWEKYGCTMAAVPATDGYLRVRETADQIRSLVERLKILES